MGNLTFGICLKFVIWNLKFTTVFFRGSVLRNMNKEGVGGLAGVFFFLIPGVEMIDKGKDFCYHLIDCGGNFLSEINLGKNLNQIGIVLDRNIPFFGQCDNLFSN